MSTIDCMFARRRRMRVSIAVCEAPEQTEKSSAELFSHVSADASWPARSRAVHVLSGYSCELWFMLLGQGTLRGGAFGQRWSLPGAPRIAGGNEFTKAKPLFPFDESNKVPPAFKQIARLSSVCFQAGFFKSSRLLSSRYSPLCAVRTGQK